MNARTCSAEALGCTAPATVLNRDCFCIDPDLAALRQELAARLALEHHAPALQAEHAGLFSALPVFASDEESTAMERLIGAIEEVVALPAYRAAALAGAPEIAARLAPVPAVLHGFDFHLTAGGPRLIEINTNAGGALLVASLLESLRCEGVPCRPKRYESAAVRQSLWQMFLDVWSRSRGDEPLRHVLIVDDAPERQYLYPEFVLFRQLFERAGVRAAVADPCTLLLSGGRLTHHGVPVDLVYNRLTDFYLEEPVHGTLRQAVLEDAVVLTPGPRAHALYANKRNLALLTDPVKLAEWGASTDTIETLTQGIPPTEIVEPAKRESLWARRKGLFFKPSSGYGSRGSYRGEKLTRRVFESILDADYVAQALTPPGARAADPADPTCELKFDVRNYVYEGRVLLRAARLYQGQTTNFRTPGGGFAPLIRPPSGG